jgi:hypothetical protein
MPMRPRSGSRVVEAPEEIVVELLARRLPERDDLDPLRVHAGHHVLDRRVLPCRVERLEDDERRVRVGGPQQLLNVGELLHALPEGVLRRGVALLLGELLELLAAGPRGVPSAQPGRGPGLDPQLIQDPLTSAHLSLASSSETLPLPSEDSDRRRRVRDHMNTPMPVSDPIATSRIQAESSLELEAAAATISSAVVSRRSGRVGTFPGSRWVGGTGDAGRPGCAGRTRHAGGPGWAGDHLGRARRAMVGPFPGRPRGLGWAGCFRRPRRRRGTGGRLHLEEPPDERDDCDEQPAVPLARTLGRLGGRSGGRGRLRLFGRLRGGPGRLSGSGRLPRRPGGLRGGAVPCLSGSLETVGWCRKARQDAAAAGRQRFLEAVAGLIRATRCKEPRRQDQADEALESWPQGGPPGGVTRGPRHRRGRSP